MFSSLLRGTVALSEAEWGHLLTRCGQPRQPDTRTNYPAANFFSLRLLFNQLAHHAKKQPVRHPPLRALLTQLPAASSADKEGRKITGENQRDSGGRCAWRRAAGSIIGG